MNVRVDFTRTDARPDADERAGTVACANDLIGRMFLDDLRKLNRLMDDFGRLCSLGAAAHVERDEDDAFVCAASTNGKAGEILMLNASEHPLPLAIECKGMTPVVWSMIDRSRTGLRIPAVATMPPMSVIAIQCG